MRRVHAFRLWLQAPTEEKLVFTATVSMFDNDAGATSSWQIEFSGRGLLVLHWRAELCQSRMHLANALSPKAVKSAGNGA